MKLFVYSIREFDERAFYDTYAKEYGISYEAVGEAPTPENIALTKGFDAISIITTPLTADMIDALKENGVRCISTRTVGYDHIDVQAAKKAGMIVCNAPYPPNSVANYTIMLMLMCLRKIPHIMKRAAVQDFSLSGKIGRDISGCTIGVIGTGKIGRTVLERLKGFGCRLLAHDIYEQEEVRKIADYVDLPTLYRESDVITLHMPSTQDNFHMIDEKEIAMMKQGVVLINTARGSLIAPDALVHNLENGKIGAAGLDVIEDESDLYYYNLCGKPLHNHEMALLQSFPNVLLTPHTAFYTDEAVGHMVKNSIAGCLYAVRGEDNPFLVRY